VTATATPEAGTNAGAGTSDGTDAGSGGPNVPAPRANESLALLFAEVTLALLTIVTAAGLGRLLEGGGDLMWTAAVVAAVGHALAAVARRRRWSWPVVLLAAVGGLVVTLGITHLWETTTFGVPSTHTIELLRAQLDQAWAAFAEVDAPTPSLPGFIAATCIAAWVCAFVADTAAFRARTSIESLAPATALFVFGAALGTSDYRLIATGAYLGALMLAWLAQRALDRTTKLIWMGGDSWFGVGALMATGVAMVALAVPIAVIVGPHLPGAQSEGVVPWRGDDGLGAGDGSRVTISPLVDIRARIVDQANTEVFIVKADERAYWRLTALENFNGSIWSSNRSYRDARGDLDSAPDAPEQRDRTIRQEYEIRNLQSFWLPAAYRAERIRGVDARYNADSGTLITEEATATDATYTVFSRVADLTARQLTTAGVVAPRSIVDTYTDLPEDFSARVTRLARQITAGASTPYEVARRLQDHFRSGQFTYDLTVESGHGDDALEEFLFETRRGYCEQFAGAYAAMARAVGLPARVAVGFTPGTLDDDGYYHVKGLNGHAWPEVYLSGFGWIGFEPTPGRGIPGAESVTGVPEAQANEGDNTNPGDTSQETTTTFPEDLTPVDPSDPTLSDQIAEPADRGWIRLVGFVTLLIGIPLLWIGLLAAVRSARRRRRRRQADQPAAEVLVSWQEADETLALAGWPRSPWETPTEFAERMARPLAGNGPLLVELARLTTEASYGRNGVDVKAAARSQIIAERLRRGVQDNLEGWERVRALVDPRATLLSSGRGRLQMRRYATD
jgi:transglutaminase-like putative cysteine protease